MTREGRSSLPKDPGVLLYKIAIKTRLSRKTITRGEGLHIIEAQSHYYSNPTRLNFADEVKNKQK